MATHNIINYADFDGTKVGLTPLKKSKDGRWNAYMNYNGKPFYIETPELRLPFGMGKFPKDSPKCQRAIVMQCATTAFFPDDDEGRRKREEYIEGINRFYDQLDIVQNMLFDFAVEHSEELFKKKLPREVIEHANLIKFVKHDEQYPRQINLKFNPKYNSERKVEEDEHGNALPDVLVFSDESEESVDTSNWNNIDEMIVKNSSICAIIQLRTVFMPGKFGGSTKVIQIQVPKVEKITKPTSYAFSKKPKSVTQDEEEAQEIQEVVQKTEVEEDVEDSEEEEEEEIEDEEEEEEEIEEIEGEE